MISVVVAAYEEPELLKALCECLARQDYNGNWEVLVCDDGSQSDLRSLVKHAADKGLNASHFWQPKHGYRIAASRNNGIRAAQGDLLIFLDADMLVRPDFLSRHAELHDGSAKIVCGTRWDACVDGTVDLLALLDQYPPEPSAEAKGQMQWLSRVPWMAMLGCNFSVPRRPEVLFDERLVGWGSDDREFSVRLTTQHKYSLELTTAAEGVHVSHSSPDTDKNPFRNRRHEDMVGFIRNKLYLYDKFPGVDLRPTLAPLLACDLDPATDQWVAAGTAVHQSYGDAIRMARAWFERNGIPLIPVPSQ